MVTGAKCLSVDEMEPLARVAMREALLAFPRPDEDLSKLSLGVELTETQGVFELYFTGPTPRDARVISSATVDRLTARPRRG